MIEYGSEVNSYEQQQQQRLKKDEEIRKKIF